MPAGRDISADAREFRRLAADLKATDKKLLTATRKGLRNAGEPAADAARRSVLSYPDTSPATAGLRRAIANAIGVQLATGVNRAGVFIVVRRAKLPAEWKAMPRALDNRKGSFRHPVYGRDLWVIQKTRPWFGVAIAKTAPQVERAVLAEIDRATRSLMS